VESISFWRIGGHERAIDFDRRTLEIASLLSSLASSQSDSAALCDAAPEFGARQTQDIAQYPQSAQDPAPSSRRLMPKCRPANTILQ